MIINAYLGPTTLDTRKGVVRFRPDGAIYEEGRVGENLRDNPARRRKGAQLLSARMFVGFNVGSTATWTIDDVIEVVKKVYKGGASFIAQQGIYAPVGGRREPPEGSAQVLIFNDAGVTRQSFTRRMIAVAERLAAELKQKEIYVDIQDSGVVVDALSVTPKKKS